MKQAEANMLCRWHENLSQCPKVRFERMASRGLWQPKQLSAAWLLKPTDQATARRSDTLLSHT